MGSANNQPHRLMIEVSHQVNSPLAAIRSALYLAAMRTEIRKSSAISRWPTPKLLLSSMPSAAYERLPRRKCYCYQTRMHHP